MHRASLRAWLLRGIIAGISVSSTTASARAGAWPAAGRDGAALLWGSGEAAPHGATAEQAARHHLEALRHVHGAASAAIRGARLLYVHDTGRGGIIVALRPTVDGVDLVHADVKVLLDRSHRLVAVSGAPHPAAVPGGARAFRLDAPRAVRAAVRELFGADVPADRVVPSREPPRAGATYFDVGGGPELRRPARVWPVYLPVGDSLVPAYRVEVQAKSRGPASFEVVVAADDGRILERRDLSQRAGFTYRVWADADGRPLDGPLTGSTPHATKMPAEQTPPPVPTTLVVMEGFNTNPDGLADPWLAADATRTRGNNVDAFAEHTDPDGDGPELLLYAKTTAVATFDREYDLAAEPLVSQEQAMAAITNLFYTTNWMHDWWYDSGFTEAAGNGQKDNFGRGGADGDALIAIAQDGALMGFRDNAFMETPADGETPRMHMFLWSALTSEVALTLQPGDQVIEAGQAVFGPKKYDVTAEVALYDDGAGSSPTDGCEPAKNDLTGKIALIDRGTCSMELKAQHAEAAGAVGVLFANNLANMGGYPPGPLDPMIVDPPIPGQGISKEDGAALKAALLDGPVTAHMFGDSPPERDGTLDNMIVAHEWGHFIHNRLVDCTSYACRGEGEGWGDFLALHMALREGDDLDGVYVGANYGGLDKTYYFAMRRAPYSVDFDYNAMTFRHITEGEPLPDSHPLEDNGFTNTEVHNAGEIWCSMMWEAYVAMHKAAQGKKSFDEVRRAMSDYVVAGMMMAPPGPTFLQQRDALLAVIAAQDATDYAAVSAAFARRGAGTCALGPPRDSFTFEGVMEDFEVRPVGVVSSVTIVDGADSCDQDGALDNDESGSLALVIRNTGGDDLAGATVSVTSQSASLIFPEGSSAPLADLAPLAEAKLEFPVALAGPLDGAEEASLVVTLTTPNGCTTEVQRIVLTVLNGDRMDGVGTRDDVEAEQTLWLAGGTGEVWSRQLSAHSGVAWHALDMPVKSDGWLASPPLEVSASEPLTISFQHAHSFDASEGDQGWLHWDGGVVELTQDGGATWEDVAKFAEPGYGGMIASSDNPLSNRPAFVRTNPSYPKPDVVTLELGTKLAGKQIRLRFRAASDSSAGAPGWDVDNIAFSGITNTPFPGWVPDPGCGGPDPTTGGPDEGSTGEPTSGATDSATGGPSQEGVDDGCGCRSDTTPGWQLLPWLALPLLRRRRR